MWALLLATESEAYCTGQRLCAPAELRAALGPGGQFAERFLRPVYAAPIAARAERTVPLALGGAVELFSKGSGRCPLLVANPSAHCTRRQAGRSLFRRHNQMARFALSPLEVTLRREGVAAAAPSASAGGSGSGGSGGE